MNCRCEYYYRNKIYNNEATINKEYEYIFITKKNMKAL